MSSVKSPIEASWREEWQSIEPSVNSQAEFLEIVNDFGSPLEVVREAISNAIDWKASYIRISFSVENVEGANRLVVRFSDDGQGMDFNTISRDFWGLGFSRARDLKKAGERVTGEKGHGTKIFLRSEKVVVRTCSESGSFEAVCDEPYRALNRDNLHQPLVREIDSLGSLGTSIEIIGYNDNERSRFVRDVVKDYINWFTKAGSIELMFGHREHEDFKVFLKCIDQDDFEQLNFGHYFPDENDDIDKLFEEYSFDATDHYVKRLIISNKRLDKHPEVRFDAMISVEGDAVKRSYNPMIRQRMRRDTGRYTVTERYGLWICKDYIPITKISDWVSGFGLGASSMTLIHGFINCQSLRLTANRGTFANTSPQIIEELKEHVQSIFDELDADLRKKGIYQLKNWQDETRTVKQEQEDFKARVKSINNRRVANTNGRVFLEPSNETEMLGFFTSIYSLFPDEFEFELLDYNSTRGIDSIARNKTGSNVRDSEFWYVELKHMLKTTFNHGFQHLRLIICWDFDRTVRDGTEFTGVDGTSRTLSVSVDDSGCPLYFLDDRKGANKVQIIRLKEFLAKRKGIDFTIEDRQH
jgi:hypothetical protein